VITENILKTSKKCFIDIFKSSAVIVGLGLATVGLIGINFQQVIINELSIYLYNLLGKQLIKYAPIATQTLEKKLASLPKANVSFTSFAETFTDVKYYKGGFEPKMSKREASLILGVR
jgi:hypothetical protein